MSVRRKVLFGGGVLAGGLVLACVSGVIEMPGRVASAQTPGVPVVAPVPAYQLSRVQIDVFELKCSHERLADFDLDRITGGEAPAREVLQRLGELGSARMLVRYDNMVDLAQPAVVRSGLDVPTVKDVVVESGGLFTPSIAYTDVGLEMTFSGVWRDDEDPLQAEIQLRIGCSGLDAEKMPVTKGVDAPMFNRRFYAEQARTVKSGHPIWLAVNDLRLSAPAAEGTTMTLVRLTATRMESR